jgi:hypothetical protein
MANAPVGDNYLNASSLIKGQLGFPLKPKLPSGDTAGGASPPKWSHFLRKNKKQLTRAKFVSYFNLEQRFEQGAGGPARGACEPEIAYAAWIWPFSLASNPAGPQRKSNSPK